MTVVTKTHNDIYNLLLDGKPHSDREVGSLIGGTTTLKSRNQISVMVCQVRKLLPTEQNLKILRVKFARKSGYQLVVEYNPNSE